MADLNLKLKIQGDSKQAEDSANRVSNALRGIEESGSKLNSTLAGLGFGVSIAGIGAFIKSGIDAADALNDLSDRTGIAIETLAGLDYAVKIGDTSIEAFSTSIQRLSVNMGKYQDDFAQIGITAKDPIEAFKQLADVFSSIEDPQQRAAVGAAALGKSYAEMAPLLLQGADGIQALIDKGKEHNPVTAEQARLAGEFNDRLDELNNRMEHFSIIVAGPVIEALNGFAQGVMFASEAVDGFDPLGWLNAGGYAASGKAGQLQYLNEQINATADAIQNLKSRSTAGQIADAIFGGENIEELDAKLLKLTKMRDALIAPVSIDSKAAPDQSAINNLLKISDDAEKSIKRVASSAKSATDTRLQSVNDVIAALQRDIELSGLSAEQQRQATELSNALKNARGAEVDVISSLVAKKYELIDVDKRQQAQWQQLISDANELVDVTRAIQDFAASDVSQSGFNSLLGRIKDDLDAGIISAEQAKAKFDELGTAFNEGFVSPAKDSTNQLSEYGVQAARNMQTAFADFLFDPFENGTQGMLEGFGNAVRRMAADAASAQIMEGLFGKTGVKDGGGILGAAVSGIVGALGGVSSAGSVSNSATYTSSINDLFKGFKLTASANGNIMTSSGPVPLNKYAGGGIASTPQLALFGEGRMPEAYVPLPDGRSIPVTMAGGSGGMVNNITINVQGGSNPDETGRKIGEAFVRTIARDEIASAARPGNKLNQTTRF